MSYIFLFSWISVAGLILGCIINETAEECGEPHRLTTEDISASLAWPILLFATITADKENIAKTSLCAHGQAVES